MLVLAFDTAGPDCSVALIKVEGDVQLLSSATEHLGRGHAERLLPLIGGVLDAAKQRYSDLDRIAVTTGPGSFTGVRVGVAAARALALALNVEAVGVSTLEALAVAAGRGRTHGTTAALIDMRRGEISAWTQNLGAAGRGVALKSNGAEAIASRLREAAEPLVLAGSGAMAVAAHLDAQSFGIVGKSATPDLTVVAMLAARGLGMSPPVPIYGRVPDAKPQAGKAVARV